ncbi:MAG: cytochrome c [Brevundimonas sp.]|uniref:c-type cytochrome n=1 Tax=Brevundimonas sp. TaxID=1871086 RepID=UPI0024886B90|nr:cytochrome c [Brevundimonas sp.]MDI1326156.1 cytochrome c [Brevundimonas sp.]
MSTTARAIAIAFALVAGGSSCARTPVAPQARAETSVSVAAEAIERGRLLTSTTCAGCHATGASGDSPLPAATPLREIAHRYPLDQLEEAFAGGLVTTHPAMPGYNFRASEIDDLIAYFETLKADQ